MAHTFAAHLLADNIELNAVRFVSGVPLVDFDVELSFQIRECRGVKVWGEMLTCSHLSYRQFQIPRLPLGSIHNR